MSEAMPKVLGEIMKRAVKEYGLEEHTFYTGVDSDSHACPFAYVQVGKRSDCKRIWLRLLPGEKFGIIFNSGPGMTAMPFDACTESVDVIVAMIKGVFEDWDKR